MKTRKLRAAASREFVGGLVWLAILTGPDISNAVRSVGRYFSTMKAIHYWKSAYGILAYINSNSDFDITYQRGKSEGISLKVFADADYACKATDRRSVSGGTIICGGACVCVGFQDAKMCHALYI